MFFWTPPGAAPLVAGASPRESGGKSVLFVADASEFSHGQDQASVLCNAAIGFVLACDI